MQWVSTVQAIRMWTLLEAAFHHVSPSLSGIDTADIYFYQFLNDTNKEGIVAEERAAEAFQSLFKLFQEEKACKLYIDDVRFDHRKAMPGFYHIRVKVVPN